MIGFDHGTAMKRDLPIVSAITALDLPDGTSIVLVVNENAYNDTENHYLLFGFQLKEFGIKINSI
jgi:hypothetical protein